MELHEPEAHIKGAGRWDMHTTRYIPVTGGSRSRLPIQEDPAYPRYAGFVGLDENLSGELFTMAALYTFLGGTPIAPEGDAFTAQIVQMTMEKLAAEKTNGE
jgi:hypothetical protein